jgi:voltage-gated potassium channel
MYYSLSTIATVGYGDYYPTSIAEKILGTIMEVFGVTIFSILMNSFVEIVVSINLSERKEKEN